MRKNLVFIVLLLGLRDHMEFFRIRQLLTTFIKSIIASCPMIALSIAFKEYFSLNGVIYLVFMIPISGLIYLLLSYLMKNIGLISFLSNMRKR
jgi:hypothetical protein